MNTGILVIVIVLSITVMGFSWKLSHKNPVHLKEISSKGITDICKFFATGAVVTLATTQRGGFANAVQGSIKSSTTEETRLAVKQIKGCLDQVKEMQVLANQGEYQKIADILSTPAFSTLDNAASVVVRSDLLSSEDKIALGTIKRYGLVADALIMLGGLSGELKSAGLKVKEAATLQAAIEDDDEAEDEEKPPVNASEVKRFLKLSLGSLADIYKIVQPLS